MIEELPEECAKNISSFLIGNGKTMHLEVKALLRYETGIAPTTFVSNCYDISNKTDLEAPLLKAICDVKRSINEYYIPPLVRI